MLDVSERPRVANWSLRAALTRYGQPQPQRTHDLIEVLRRIDVGVRQRARIFERDGERIWRAFDDGEATTPELDAVLEFLRVVRDVDGLGDLVAAWASDPRSNERPDAALDAVVPVAARRLDDLGVPREEERRPPHSRG